MQSERSIGTSRAEVAGNERKVEVIVSRCASTFSLGRDDFHVSVRISTLDCSASLAEPQERNLPYIRGWLISSQCVIQLENIERACITRGQRFTERVLLALVALAPEAHLVRIANVTHRVTQDVLRTALGPDRRTVVPAGSLRGPLLQSLSSIGCTAVQAELEGASYYHALGLLGARPNRSFKPNPLRGSA